jgi:hypothetical protein
LEAGGWEKTLANAESMRQQQSSMGFVSGHDFSRAAQAFLEKDETFYETFSVTNAHADSNGPRFLSNWTDAGDRMGTVSSCSLLTGTLTENV